MWNVEQNKKNYKKSLVNYETFLPNMPTDFFQIANLSWDQSSLHTHFIRHIYYNQFNDEKTIEHPNPYNHKTER